MNEAFTPSAGPTAEPAGSASPVDQPIDHGPAPDAPHTTTYWCELAWLGGPSPAEGVVLHVAGDRIVGVQRCAAPQPAATVLRGLTLPGLANGHSHAFHRALRGRTHGGGGTFWTWREQMYALAGTLTPTTYQFLATAVFAEMVQAGYTCVGEFHYLHHAPGGTPYADRNEFGAALVAAATTAGIRLTLLDTCYLTGGIGKPAEGAQLRFSDGSVEAWAERVGALADTDSVRVGAAIHSVRAVPPDEMDVVAGWATDHSAPLHAHVSEQPAENEECRAAFGRTPTQLLADNGVLSERFTSVHATHLTTADVDLYAQHRCVCCMCPTTERDLADGIGPTAGLRAAGVALAIGSDSHAIIDPLEELRAVELDERLRSGKRGVHPVVDLLAAGTSGGYLSLGWSDGGRIEPGALADFVTIRLDSERLAGTDPEHSLAAAVFAGTAADVHHVVVGGRPVVVDGRHVTVNVAGALAASITQVWR